MKISEKFKICALGGTFDHFHAGHRQFLSFASKQADHIIVGLTRQELTTNKKYASRIQSYQERKEAVEEFLHTINISFEIIELKDMFGPTLGEREIDCLIVTELTVDGAEQINAKRRAKKLSQLSVAVSSMFKDESGEILNSTRIRAGQVNREGIVFSQIFSKDHTISSSQKELLRHSWGAIVKHPFPADSDTFIAVVGDRCLHNFIENDWKYFLGIYDLKEQRAASQKTSHVHQIIPTATLPNPPGSISHQVVKFLLTSIEPTDPTKEIRQHLLIDGEEDLLVVPLILLLPLQSRVYYGQPHVGMVEVVVTEEIKERVYGILEMN